MRALLPRKPATLPAPGKSSVRRFFRAASGAAAVEFAIIVMPFLGLVLGGVQMGVNYLFISQLDYATRKAGQAIRSGQVRIQQTTAANFTATILCPQLTAVSCASVLVNAQVVRTETDWPLTPTFVASPTSAKWCPGAGGELVLLQAALKLPLMFFDFYGSSTRVGGDVYYVASTSFRNEPSGGWSSTC